jgi:hypothetical protein
MRKDIYVVQNNAEEGKQLKEWCEENGLPISKTIFGFDPVWNIFCWYDTLKGGFIANQSVKIDKTNLTQVTIEEFKALQLKSLGKINADLTPKSEELYILPDEGCFYGTPEQQTAFAKFLCTRPFCRADAKITKDEAIGIGWNKTSHWWLKTKNSQKQEYNFQQLRSFIKVLEEPQFEKGKWYKINNNWWAKFETIHGSGTYWRGSEKITALETYIKDSSTLENWKDSNFLLADLNEIQKYLPDGHVDKIVSTIKQLKEEDFIKGKWYKDTKHHEVRYCKFDYLKDGYVHFTDFIYPNSRGYGEYNGNWGFRNNFIEVDVLKIQEFLPNGHVDKISEPVKEWMPKVGDWIYAERSKDDYRAKEFIPVFKLEEICEEKGFPAWLRPEKRVISGVKIEYCRPATQDEIPKEPYSSTEKLPEYVKLIKDWSVDDEYMGEVFELSSLDNLSKFKNCPTKEQFRKEITSWIEMGYFRVAAKEEWEQQNKPSLVGRYIKALIAYPNGGFVKKDEIGLITTHSSGCYSLYADFPSQKNYTCAYTNGNYELLPIGWKPEVKPKDEVVHCKTQEEWDFVTKTLKYDWEAATWDDYKQHSCINIKQKGYGSKTYHPYRDCAKILSFEEWLNKEGITMEKTESLLEEAKRRYPVGTKFYPAHLQQREEFCIITKGCYFEEIDGNIVSKLPDGESFNVKNISDYGLTCYNRNVYWNGRWAEIINECSTNLKQWLKETKAKNLSLEELMDYIDNPETCNFDNIFTKLKGGADSKAEILWNEWNPKEICVKYDGKLEIRGESFVTTIPDEWGQNKYVIGIDPYKECTETPKFTPSTAIIIPVKQKQIFKN